MTDSTIHNLQYFLKELEKDLNHLEALFEQEYTVLKRIHVLHGVMFKICQNWLTQLEYRK